MLALDVLEVEMDRKSWWVQVSIVNEKEKFIDATGIDQFHFDSDKYISSQSHSYF